MTPRIANCLRVTRKPILEFVCWKKGGQAPGRGSRKAMRQRWTPGQRLHLFPCTLLRSVICRTAPRKARGCRQRLQAQRYRRARRAQHYGLHRRFPTCACAAFRCLRSGDTRPPDHGPGATRWPRPCVLGGRLGRGFSSVLSLVEIDSPCHAALLRFAAIRVWSRESPGRPWRWVPGPGPVCCHGDAFAVSLGRCRPCVGPDFTLCCWSLL